MNIKKFLAITGAVIFSFILLSALFGKPSAESVFIDSLETMFQIGEDFDIPEGLIGSSKHGCAIDLNQDKNRPEYQQTILSPFSLCRLK